MKLIQTQLFFSVKASGWLPTNIGRENKMAYKMIKEWRSPNGIEHEITVYKYNIGRDEMVRYYKTADSFTVYTYPVLCQEPKVKHLEA